MARPIHRDQLCRVAGTPIESELFGFERGAFNGRVARRRALEYQRKLDGYRAIAFKSQGAVHLRSRNDKDFTLRYPDVVKGATGRTFDAGHY
jgi:hypothetical protein